MTNYIALNLEAKAKPVSTQCVDVTGVEQNQKNEAKPKAKCNVHKTLSNNVNLPKRSSDPKSVRFPLVVQFHLLNRNCHLHSDTAICAPLLTYMMAFGRAWHMLLC